MLKLSPMILIAAFILSSCGSKDKKKDLPAFVADPAETDDPIQGGLDTVIADNVGTVSASSKFVAHLEWISEVRAENFVSAQLTFAKIDRTAPDSVEGFVFDPQMPSMGHGTSVQDQVLTPDTDKHFVVNVEGIYFIMGGPWEINVTAVIDGVKDSVIFPVQVP